MKREARLVGERSTCHEDDADAVARDAEIAEDIRVDRTSMRMVAAVRVARKAAEVEAEKAQRATRDAARRLTSSGLSLRDVAYLLGISHQRVKQLA